MTNASLIKDDPAKISHAYLYNATDKGDFYIIG